MEEPFIWTSGLSNFGIAYAILIKTNTLPNLVVIFPTRLCTLNIPWYFLNSFLGIKSKYCR